MGQISGKTIHVKPLYSLRFEQPAAGGELWVRDVTGRVVARWPAEGPAAVLRLNGLVDGTYLLELRLENKAMAVRKISVLR